MSERPSHTQIAVALRWDGQGAPKVTAKGRGDTAEKILQLASEHGITLQHEKELVELLVLVELNHEIPQSLYVAIAEIIAFAYSLSGKSPVV
ncbi:MAG: EscU/YscU/HrcU family type III secretion system export apparatus switch protein [Proteobacteria bacterium]|nr:EscU/YscU/HrcU family type III secretion system export apparatus switch protein [Pseudomonadota bacterium]